MPVFDNNKPEDNSNPFPTADSRNKRIATLPLSKQFTLRTQINSCDNLSKEQAIEFLKELLVQQAVKDDLLIKMHKSF